jgi:hypothetical protein
MACAAAVELGGMSNCMDGLNAGSDEGDMPESRRPAGYSPGALVLPLDGPGVFAGVMLAWRGGRRALAGSPDWVYVSDRVPGAQAVVCRDPVDALALASRHQAMSAVPKVFAAASGPAALRMLPNKKATVLPDGAWPSAAWMAEALQDTPELMVAPGEPGEVWLARELSRMPAAEAVKALSGCLLTEERATSLLRHLGPKAPEHLLAAVAAAGAGRSEVSIRGAVFRRTAMGYFMTHPSEEWLSNFTLDVVEVVSTEDGVALECALDCGGAGRRITVPTDLLTQRGAKVARGLWEEVLRSHGADLQLHAGDPMSCDWLQLVRAFGKAKLSEAAEPLGAKAGWLRLPLFKIHVATGEVVEFKIPAKRRPAAEACMAVAPFKSTASGALAVLSRTDSHGRALSTMALHLLHQTVALGAAGVKRHEQLVVPVERSTDFVWEAAALELWHALSGRGDAPEVPAGFAGLREFRKAHAGGLPMVLRLPDGHRKPYLWLAELPSSVILASPDAAAVIDMSDDASFMPDETTAAADRVCPPVAPSALLALRAAWPALLAELCKTGLPPAETAAESARMALSMALGVELPEVLASRELKAGMGGVAETALALLAKMAVGGELRTGKTKWDIRYKGASVLETGSAVGLAAARCGAALAAARPRLKPDLSGMQALFDAGGYSAPESDRMDGTDRICWWIRPEVWDRFRGKRAPGLRMVGLARTA